VIAMKKHILLILTNTVEGREDEFNDWYNGHVMDILALDGFSAAQRFVLADVADPEIGPPPYRYLALYEIEDERLPQARDSLLFARREREASIEAGREEQLRDAEYGAWFYSAITDRREAPSADQSSRQRGTVT
jgi:hypothetical protein